MELQTSHELSTLGSLPIKKRLCAVGLMSIVCLHENIPRMAMSSLLQEAFTLVLKGHIDLCQLVFPAKTHGRCVSVYCW